MNWFETTGFANIAKNALKEAQKTIDKALDIKEEDRKNNDSNPKVNEKLMKETQDFFTSFGINEDSTATKEEQNESNIQNDKFDEASAGMVGSLWGSFTGSFFDNAKAASNAITPSSESKLTLESIIETQPPRRLEKLPSPSSNSTNSSSIVQLSSEPTSPFNEASETQEPLEENLNPSDWNNWESIMTSGTQVECNEQYSGICDDPPEEILADDSIDHDGFARSRLVVRSIESESTARQDSVGGSLHSTRSQFDIDISQNIVEEFAEDPFEDGCESTIVKDVDNVYSIKDLSKNIVLPVSNSERINSAPPSTIFEPPQYTELQESPLSFETSDQPEDSVESDSGGKHSSSIETINSPLSEISLLDNDSSSSSITEAVSINKNSQPWTPGIDIPAITKQPISSVLPKSFEESSSIISSSQQESLPVGCSPSDDSSVCDSVYSASTASTLTALDHSIFGRDITGSPETSKEMDRKKKLGLEKMVDADNETRESISKSNAIKIREEYIQVDNSGLQSSTRSESSTETITTSVDSQNFLWADSISMEETFTENERILDPMSEVQCLLEEAMDEEKEECSSMDFHEQDIHDTEESPVSQQISKLSECREQQSPTSSEKSDHLKVGSEYTSGHSSADEMETATSSDIEVISSPSMDSNNGHSRGFHAGSNMVSKFWNSTQKGLKPILGDRAESSASNSSNSKRNGNNGYDKAETVPSSMTTSITSISESEGDNFHIPSTEFLQESARISQALLKEFNIYERGHRRNQSNISETSESSSEHTTPEIEKLFKKLAQTNEILHVREAKVLELSQANVSLQELNNSLKLRLDELERRGSSDTTESVREEFTQRLVTMERKFQQALRDKEIAKKQYEECRAEASTRLSTKEVYRQLEDKETVINELREEGEKLSKQERQHLNIIKKLRTKEKENDSCIKTQKEKIEDQSRELERLQKQLTAKEEVERSQIDAIRRLTLANEKNEIVIKDLQASNAETEGKMSTIKDALDAAYKEITELQRLAATRDLEAQELALSAEVSARQRAESTLQEIKGQNKREQEALLAQIHELNDEVKRVELQANRNERRLKMNITDLESRLSESESRCDELSNSVSDATRPLLRQMENLRASHNSQQANWETLEESLTRRLNDALSAVAASAEKERESKEQYVAVLSEITNFQAQLANIQRENASLLKRNQTLQLKVTALEESKSRESNQLEALKSSFAEEINEIKHERDLLDQQLDIERTALGAEKKKAHQLQEQIKEKDKRLAQQQLHHHSQDEINRSTPRSSPTPSLSRASVSGSVLESHWGDEVFDNNWTPLKGVYDSLRGNSAATMEILTSSLRQREGEVHHLQNEMTRHEAQKESLAQELVQLSENVDKLQTKLKDQENLDRDLKDLEQKYNALLQMYGEKVEEVDELRLDLVDVKEMYKSQIDQLLKK